MANPRARTLRPAQRAQVRLQRRVQVEALASGHPGVEVGRIAYTNEIWIGGEEGVPISRIQAWLERVRRALVDCLANAGIEVPDLRASRSNSDDDLP